MRSLTLLLPPLVVLAACNPAEVRNEQQPAAPASPAPFTDVQRRVVDLPQQQRFGVFLRAIRDGGAPCQQVVQEIRQPDHQGSPLFAVRCDDGPRYAIAIDAKGIALVTKLNPSAG
jgi:hypothetical protein